MGIVYTGLDAGSTGCHVVALTEHGEVVLDKSFPTSEANLISVFRSIPGEVHVHLEAAELAGWIRRVIKPHVAKVILGDTKVNAWIAKDPHKNDGVDAFKLAELQRMGRVHEVYYPDDDHLVDFRRIVYHYDDITRQQARLKVKIKSRFRYTGVIPRGKEVYSPDGRVAYLAKVRLPGIRETLGHLYKVLDQTLEAQKEAKALMANRARRYPEIELFETHPGVGVVTACQFFGYIQDPFRFRNRRALCRYCRLGITDRSSDGKPLGRKKLDPNGNRRLKTMSRQVFQATMRCNKTTNRYQRYFQHRARQGDDPTKIRLSIQRKIVVTLWTMWKGGIPYQDDLA